MNLFRDDPSRPPAAEAARPGRPRHRLVAAGVLSFATLVAPLAGVAGAHGGSSDPGGDGRSRSGSDRTLTAGSRSPSPSWASGQGRSDPAQQGSRAEQVRSGPTKRDAKPDTRPDPKPDTTNPAANLNGVQHRCVAAIDRRLVQLDRLSREVGAASSLTGAHAAALGSILAASRAGLTQLEATIEADTDPAALQAHCQEIVTGFRVYALVTPQVHLVIAADRTSASAARLDQASAEIAAAIAKAAAAGQDTTKAADLLAQMQREVAAGTATVAGVADQVLAVTPAGYNADPGVLGPSRPALAEAQRHLRSARSLGARAVAALRSDH